MQVLDDRGRLFGTVNIIDLVALLLVLAVFVAGVALVNPFASQTAPSDTTPETGVRYVTIDLGEQPTFIADLITTGDNALLPAGNLTITDVVTAPTSGGGIHITVRARVPGRLTPGERGSSRGFTVDGDPVIPGENLRIETLEYTVSGTLKDVSRSGRSLSTQETPVVLRTTVPTEVAWSVSPGDEIRAGSRTVGRVERVQPVPTSDPSSVSLIIGATLSSLGSVGNPMFGNRSIEFGSAIPVPTQEYTTSGDVIHRGDTTLPGTRQTVAAAVRLGNMDPEIAAAIDPGAVERFGETETARVQDVTVEPSTAIVESEDGNIYGRDHPRLKDVRLTVELHVRQTPTGLQFHARPLRIDRSIVLDLGDLTVSGQVVELRR